MASVKYGAFITDIKGSIGGQTFKGTRSGGVMQNKVCSSPLSKGGARLAVTGAPMPINPQVALRMIVSQWRGLSAAQRSAWNSFAPSLPFINKFGESYTASGYQCFVFLNMNLITSEQNSIDDPPMIEELPDAPTYQIEVVETPALSVTVAVDVPAGYVWSLDYAVIARVGQTPNVRDFRRWINLEAGSYTAEPLPIVWSAGIAPNQAIEIVATNSKITKADAGLIKKGAIEFPSMVPA